MIKIRSFGKDVAALYHSVIAICHGFDFCIVPTQTIAIPAMKLEGSCFVNRLPSLYSLLKEALVTFKMSYGFSFAGKVVPFAYWKTTTGQKESTDCRDYF